MDSYVLTRRNKRKLRVRSQLKDSALPRLSIHRSNIHMYAQIVDQKTGKILAATTDKALVKDTKSKLNKTQRAEKVGQAIAEQALAKKIKQVVFDRAGYRYHGRVKAVAESARAAGLTL